jgi:hypothetical protein
MSITQVSPEQATQQEPVFDIAKHMAERNARDTARAAGKEPPPVEKPAEAEPEKPVEAKAEEPVKSSKPTGDQRKLFKTLRENGELRARLAMLEEKINGATKEAPKAAESASDEPKRFDFATDDEYRDARAEWKAKTTTENVLKAKEVETVQNAEVSRVADQFDKQMRLAQDSYPDWSELLKSSKAANIDIYAAAPELFGAFISSEYAKDVMYEWLKNPETLEFIIDAYKTDPRSALKAFHRMEGRVAREVEASSESESKTSKKATEPGKKAAEVEEKPKPRPTASMRAPAGEAPPDEPAPGTKAWMERRNAGIRSRGW